MGPTTELRRALKNRFFTYAETHGFEIDKRRQPISTLFRRRAGASVQILELQWDKYGRRRFRLHFGACPAEDFVVDGTTIRPADAHPSWCAVNGTLRPRRGFTGGTSFRQEASWLERLRGYPRLHEPDVVVDRLLARFPEIERFWESGVVGPHLKIWPSRTG